MDSLATFDQALDRIAFGKREEIPSVPAKDLIEEAFAHLGAAKSQFIDSDDQIIKEHVLAAYELIRVLYRSSR